MREPTYYQRCRNLTVFYHRWRKATHHLRVEMEKVLDPTRNNRYGETYVWQASLRPIACSDWDPRMARGTSAIQVFGKTRESACRRMWETLCEIGSVEERQP